MDYKLEAFINFAQLFESHGYQLYLVGGSVRDYLLGIPLMDMDVVTDATPEQEKEFLEGGEYAFEKYGSIRFSYDGVKFDVTTLRKETGYIDSRHPSEVVFTNRLEEDVYRRDITINALYLSKDLKCFFFFSNSMILATVMMNSSTTLPYIDSLSSDIRHLSFIIIAAFSTHYFSK